MDEETETETETETTSLFIQPIKTPVEGERRELNESPTTISRRMRINNNNGEHSLNMVLVVEDFRLAYYLGAILISVIGVILTKLFAKGDVSRYIKQV